VKDAASLGCPRCGSPAALDSVRCDYCKAALQTVACPSCFGLIFFDSKFCPRCGAKAEFPAPEHAAADCPRCAKRMAFHTLGGCGLDQCRDCGGIWLDNAVFEEIQVDRDKQAAFLPPGEDSKLKTHDPTKGPLVYLGCPRCGDLMNRVNFAGRSGVLLDVCKPHGTWFDAQELRAIVEFIRAGGLDLARQDRLERLREEKRRIEKELAERPVPGVPGAAADLSEKATAGRLLRFLLDGR
jgi:Zn-finger nucleic acid-binding protein